MNKRVNYILVLAMLSSSYVMSVESQSPIAIAPVVTTVEGVAPVVTTVESVAPVAIPVESVAPVVTTVESVAPVVTTVESVAPVVTTVEQVGKIVNYPRKFSLKNFDNIKNFVLQFLLKFNTANGSAITTGLTSEYLAMKYLWPKYDKNGGQASNSDKAIATIGSTGLASALALGSKWLVDKGFVRSEAIHGLNAALLIGSFVKDKFFPGLGVEESKAVGIARNLWKDKNAIINYCCSMLKSLLTIIERFENINSGLVAQINSEKINKRNIENVEEYIKIRASLLEIFEHFNSLSIELKTRNVEDQDFLNALNLHYKYLKTTNLVRSI